VAELAGLLAIPHRLPAVARPSGGEAVMSCLPPEALGDARHNLQREHRRLIDKEEEPVPIDHR
jgi:hypothetical protein